MNYTKEIDHTKETNHKSKTYVLYHANCLDGFASAVVCYSVFKEEAIYIPCKYQEPVPELEPNSIIYLVDFSYKRPVMLQLLEDHEEVITLDHHKTAQEELLGVRGTLFNMSKCGAVLTWEYFFPGRKLPLLLLIIQDRDLWQWKVKYTREVTAALWVKGFGSLKAWLLYLASDTALNELIAEGKAMVAVQDSIINQQVKQAYLSRGPDGVLVPTINSGILVSETLAAVLKLKQWREYPYAIAWVENNDNINYSLRSNNSEHASNVGAVAKLKGGGGHPQAAGYIEFKSPEDAPVRNAFKFQSCNGQNSIKGFVQVGTDLAIHIEGYGSEHGAEEAVILLSQLEDSLELFAWADRSLEDFSHKITFEQARLEPIGETGAEQIDDKK